MKLSTGIEDKLKNDSFNLLAFLVTSARNCVEEPKLYGSLRLIDAASRLIEILEEVNMADEFFVEVGRRINEAKSLMDDKGEFTDFLDVLILDFVDRLKKRG